MHSRINDCVLILNLYAIPDGTFFRLSLYFNNANVVLTDHASKTLILIGQLRLAKFETPAVFL
jgi:hypothetical protein